MCSPLAHPVVHPAGPPFCAARQPAENSCFSFGNKALQPTQPRVAKLDLLEPKTRNLAVLRSSWLQNFYLAVLQHFLQQIFLGEELRVVRVASRHHKTRSGPLYSCVMLNEHTNIPKKREKLCKWNAQLVSCSVHWICSCCTLHCCKFQCLN